MPIRFPCPGCNQPLEVDNEWGGQTVACPYCRRVITAPTSSAWPTSPIPLATAVQQPPAGFAPPPPPPGFSVSPRQSTSSRAVLAFVLASVGAGISVIAFMWFAVVFWSTVVQKTGMAATPAEMQEVAEQLASRGQIPRPPLLVGLLMTGAITSLTGLVLGARSMAQRESGKGLAITACILGGLFLLCPLLWGSALFR
jgi:hypothetical protein